MIVNAHIRFDCCIVRGIAGVGGAVRCAGLCHLTRDTERTWSYWMVTITIHSPLNTVGEFN